jgi:2-dehydro-3-deoxyphosphogalactonate aldolase
VRYLHPLPLIAVLRGIRPDDVEPIGDVLVDAGFRILEVPLNSPDPFASIETLARRFGEHCLTGAGTVLEPGQVADVERAGGRLVVMPHGDVAIVKEAKRRGMICAPGVATPTEAFAALGAGADGLKMFPAEMLSPAVLKAWRAVLPRGTLVFPVGGIAPDNMEPYARAGASGFGTGSNLFRPGADVETVRAVARRFADAVHRLRGEGLLAAPAA